MNNIFQEYKRNVDNGVYEECQVVITSNVPQIAEARVATFNPNKFRRSKEKKKTQKMIDEYYKGEDR